MYIVTIRAHQSIECDALIFEARVRRYFIFMAASTIFRLGFRLRQWVIGSVQLMTADTGYSWGVMGTASPLHTFGLTHILGMAVQAGCRLLWSCTFIAKAQQGRESRATSCSGYVQAARPVAGLAALLRIGGVWIIRIAVGGFAHQGHPFAAMTTQAALGASGSKLRSLCSRTAAVLCRSQLRLAAQKCN